MNYFIFKPATDTPETGHVYPQVQKMSRGYNYKAPNSVHALSKAYQTLPDYIPDLDYFVVSGKAKLSDLLSVAVADRGFLISDKLKEIFEQFNLPIHKFYQAKVYHKKQFYKYHWMHIICDLTDIVDYKKSIFFTYYNYAHNLGYIDVNSKDDLIQRRKKLKEDNPSKTITVWAEKITLKNTVDRNLDLIKIGNFDSNYYISERLNKTIIESNVTGADIKLASNIVIK